MRIRETIVQAGILSAFTAALLFTSEASAQTTQQVPVIAPRDKNWGIVSDVTLVISVASATLMPRIYYNDPEATVGWKGRWHLSVLAPAMTLTAATFLVNGPIKNAIQKPRPGCTIDSTISSLPGQGCESYGMPSTHAFAAWGATGAGTGIFLVDTLKYSAGKFNVGGFIGNVAVPLISSIFTSVGRGIGANAASTSTTLPATATVYAYETPLQVVAGTLSGFITGVGVGVAYSLFQRPNCGYGNSIFCW
jgi:membrane-associated phospholipid phosphatase